jgi:hypothetical protein
MFACASSSAPCASQLCAMSDRRSLAAGEFAVRLVPVGYPNVTPAARRQGRSRMMEVGRTPPDSKIGEPARFSFAR